MGSHLSSNYFTNENHECVSNVQLKWSYPLGQFHPLLPTHNYAALPAATLSARVLHEIVLKLPEFNDKHEESVFFFNSITEMFRQNNTSSSQSEY